MAGSKFLIPLDPSDLEWRYASDAVVWPESFFEGLPEGKRPQHDRVLDLIRMLPQREQDIVTLYYLNQKDQRDIGNILSITQGDVSYRLKRAIKRIRFLLELPDIDVQEMKELLTKVLPSEQYVKIMVGIYETSSQTAVAKMVGISQGKVRYRFLRGLEVLKKHAVEDRRFETYCEAFRLLGDNFNILRALQAQTRWRDKFHDMMVV